ncbi:MAG: MaoC family dehydratase N-terminal domain-containing protein [Thermodesulfobacteriota bacterium]
MDLDKKFIGRKYGPVTYEIGREKIAEYAMAIKNPDPHYVDEAFARKTPYGDIIAPPTFAVVYAGKLIVPFFFDSELNLNLAMLVHGEQEFEFHEIVRPRDVITTMGEITGIVNKEKLDVVTICGESRNQDNVLVCTAKFTFVIRK